MKELFDTTKEIFALLLVCFIIALFAFHIGYKTGQEQTAFEAIEYVYEQCTK